MNPKFSFICILLLTVFTIHGCKEEYVTPTLSTINVNEITLVSAKSGGDITDNGGDPVTARGICWSTSQNPTTANSHTTDGSGSGTFTSSLTGLISGTTYYVRAYATNSAGTGYGNQVSFNTSQVSSPALTTSDVSAITPETVVSGGNITADGGGTITARGVCWSTSENPTIADSITTDGTGTGIFVSNISGLNGSTTYYIKAYATNSTGTAYGNQVSFTTAEVVPPSLITTPAAGLTSTTATSGGTISSKGGGAITAKGVCWSTSENPTLANSFTNDGTGPLTFISSITGLTDGNVYYVRAYATNSAGTAYGNNINFITPVTDIEGNIYRTVVIGNQVWMAENLKVEKLTDNTLIPNITDNSSWISQTNPAFSWLSNNSSNKNTFGALYNWFAVNTGKLCPAGWHVPSDAEYNTMEQYLGIPESEINLWGFRGTDQGTRLKSTSTWNGSGNGTNSSGFDALAGGYRAWSNGSFPIVGEITYFWSATDDAANGNPGVAWYRRLDSSDPRIYKATTEKPAGKYVRCIKNP